MLAISTAGAHTVQLDNGRPALRRHLCLIEAPKLERSSQYLFLQASITSISTPRDVLDLILAPYSYDRIVGALSNLGFAISDQTVGNVLHRNGLLPAPARKYTTTWATFIRTHLALLAGTDFFTAEVLTLRGLVTYYVLFFIHLESRRVEIAGITVHPDEPWMKQIARTLPWRDAVSCGTVATFCTIATRNTLSRSGQSSHQARFNLWRCLRAART